MEVAVGGAVATVSGPAVLVGELGGSICEKYLVVRVVGVRVQSAILFLAAVIS